MPAGPEPDAIFEREAFEAQSRGEHGLMLIGFPGPVNLDEARRAQERLGIPLGHITNSLAVVHGAEAGMLYVGLIERRGQAAEQTGTELSKLLGPTSRWCSTGVRWGPAHPAAASRPP